jgi:hypothetical protein
MKKKKKEGGKVEGVEWNDQVKYWESTRDCVNAYPSSGAHSFKKNRNTTKTEETTPMAKAGSKRKRGKFVPRITGSFFLLRYE